MTTTETDSAAAPATEEDLLVRSIRFEVVFPGYRRADLEPLWKQLWALSDDLRLAANRVTGAVWSVLIGGAPHPIGVSKRGKNAGKEVPIHPQSLCYQALSGQWQPYGQPLYQSTTELLASSSVRLALAGVIWTRLKADHLDILHGKTQLPSFRKMPLVCSSVQVDPEVGNFTLSPWEGGKKKLTVRPRKLDPHMWRKIRSAVRFGDCELSWDQPVGRKGRWMLSVSGYFHKKKLPETPPLIASVRLGYLTTCTLAFVHPATKKPQGQVESINLPSTVEKATARLERERTERGRWNRLDAGLREGRGRAKKLRATENLSDKLRRVTTTAVRQTAAAVVNLAIRRGATALAIPDLKTWSVNDTMEKTEELPEVERALRRKWYFARHQGEIRAQIQQVCETRGLPWVSVPVADANRTCFSCGKLTEAAPRDREWKCGCGAHRSTEANTAIVLAQRGADEIMRSLSEETSPKAKVPKRTKKKEEEKESGE